MQWTKENMLTYRINIEFWRSSRKMHKKKLKKDQEKIANKSKQIKKWKDKTRKAQRKIKKLKERNSLKKR